MADKTPIDKKHVHEGDVVAKVVVVPQQSSRLSLGTYSTENPPVGFSMEFSPEPDPPCAIMANVTPLPSGRGSEYRLLCLLDNYGTRTVTVTIRQMTMRDEARSKAVLLHGGPGAAIELVPED